MALPTQDPNRWLKLEVLFTDIRGVKSVDQLLVKLREISETAGLLVQDLDGYDRYGEENHRWPFSGLGIYLTKLVTRDEREEFFNIILPYVGFLAGKVVSSLNEGEISLERQGNDLRLNYEVVAGFLACDFLGANLFARNSTLASKHNFADVFGRFHSQSLQAVLASKLRCVLQYFRRLSTRDNTWCSSRMVTFSSKSVHDYNSLPSLDTWLSDNSPLCPVKVDYKSDVTVADGNTTEFNFVRHLPDDGHPRSEDCKQDDHTVLQYPELLVAGWIFEHVHSDEAIIVKKDEWNNFYVATTGVSIQPQDIHDYRRIFCNQLNRTWIGLSSNSSTTINKETYSTNQNAENNVSVIQNNASFSPKQAIQGPVDTSSSQNSSTVNNESPICKNGVNNLETALHSYSELLSQFLVREATQDVSRRRCVPEESKCSMHEVNEQSPCDQIDQRNEHLAHMESKVCNKRSQCTPFKSVSTTCSTLNYTYADLLLQSLTLSVHRAVSLTSVISNLVNQSTCVLLLDGNDLRNKIGIDKLKTITSNLNESVLCDRKTLFPKCPSVKFNSLPGRVNGCSPGYSVTMVSSAATVFYSACSCLETMASNLAQSITQSAIMLASQILSPEHSNSGTPSDSCDKNQLSTHPPTLSTDTNTARTVSEEITNDKSRDRSSTENLSDISKNSAFTMNDSIVSNDLKSGNISLEVSEQTRQSSSRQQWSLDLFTETMSNKILSSVIQRARTMTLLNDDEDKKQSLSSHNPSPCVPDEDIQLQIAIQWIVASTMGCPCLICYTKEEIQSNNMAWISDRAHKNGWLVSDIVECILEFYQTKLNNHVHDQSQLFDVLQSKIKDPKH